MKQAISQLMVKKYGDYQYRLPEYNNDVNFDWLRTQSGLPWLKLELNIPTDTVLQEISRIQNLLVNHRYSEYHEHQGWYSFCIHGKSYDATREDSYYNDNRPCGWTVEAQNLMPQTVKYFSQDWPGQVFYRIRVMLLEPGGYIGIHKDNDKSELTAINVAITQPQDCKFVMEKHGCVPFESGTAFWLDLSNNHTVFNHSDKPRWHIIVHQEFNDTFQKLVVNSYKRLYNKS